MTNTARTAKHTPGPWEVTGPHSREVITTNPSTYKPCMTIAKVGGYWDGEAQANAHLIAAAPAMYEALSSILKDIEKVEPRTLSGYANLCAMFRTVAKVALAQAEGRG